MLYHGRTPRGGRRDGRRGVSPHLPFAAAAASAPRSDPTITIRVGGIRAAENRPAGAARGAPGSPGARFRVTPASAGLPRYLREHCRRPVHAQRERPAGRTRSRKWAPRAAGSAGSSLAAGAPGQVTVARAYDTLSVAVGAGNVTIPVAAPNSDTSATARGGTWALSRDDPFFAARGVRAADRAAHRPVKLDIPSDPANLQGGGQGLRGVARGHPLEHRDLHVRHHRPGARSHATPPSRRSPRPIRPALPRWCARSTGSPSRPVPRDELGRGLLADRAGTCRLTTTSPPSSSPTATRPITDRRASLGGRGNLTRFAETENGIFSANALKNAGASVLSVGIGTARHETAVHRQHQGGLRTGREHRLLQH